MFFGSKDKGQRSPLHTLSEGDIRGRLYGSAVGIALDTQVRPSRKHRDREEKSTLITREFEEERIKIHKELESLRRDLEQTRRKLDRMRGLRSKKIRLLAVYMAIFLIATTLTIITIKQFFLTPKIATQPVIAEHGMLYSIQVAVYGNGADARRFSSDLNLKGYKTFVKESSFKSGRVKFIVYADGFKDKKAASRILDRLRTNEGISDSFITSMPE